MNYPGLFTPGGDLGDLLFGVGLEVLELGLDLCGRLHDGVVCCLVRDDRHPVHPLHDLDSGILNHIRITISIVIVSGRL